MSDSDQEEKTIVRKKKYGKKPQQPAPDQSDLHEGGIGAQNIPVFLQNQNDLNPNPNINQSSVLDWKSDDPLENNEAHLFINQNQNQNYDLKKGIRLTVASDRKEIHCSKSNNQKLSTVVSLRTLELTSQENQVLDELNPSDNRLPIDLISVIDCSGSMTGQKIETVQNALKMLLQFFSDKDRLSIIKFDSRSKKLMGLKRVSTANMDGILKTIADELRAGGSTSIPEGVKEAVKTIKNRTHKNKIVSVFVLSDGNDNDQNAADTIKLMLSEEAAGLEFSIHTFGFGDDHDSKLLSEICKLKNGNFYYIQNLDKINDCFVNAFGGLLSIVGREALLTVKLEKAGNTLHELSDMKWLKAYGDFWNYNPNTNNYEINIQNLMNGMKRDYVIDIQIPRITSKIPENQKDQLLMTCILSAKSIETNEIVVTEAQLKAKFFEENEEFKESTEEANEQVVLNLFRVQVGEALEAAKELCEASKFDDATKLIEALINKILVSKYAKNETLTRFIEQLESNKEGCKPQVYNDYGRHMLINESELTMKQAGIRGIKNKKKVDNPSNNDDDEDENENTIQRTLKRKIKPKTNNPAPVPNKNIVNPNLLSTVTEKSSIMEQGSKFN